MNVRAKFVCAGKSGNAVSLTAATNGPDNESWSKHTPSGTVTMQITNPLALERFEPGKSYFVDFTPAE